MAFVLCYNFFLGMCCRTCCKLFLLRIVNTRLYMMKLIISPVSSLIKDRSFCVTYVYIVVFPFPLLLSFTPTLGHKHAHIWTFLTTELPGWTCSTLQGEHLRRNGGWSGSAETGKRGGWEGDYEAEGEEGGRAAVCHERGGCQVGFNRSWYFVLAVGVIL